MWQNDNENIEMTLPDDELEHHGVKGQKWGVRRFQNSDGSLTDSGRKRYLKGASKKKKSDSTKGGESKPKKTPLKKMSVEQLRKVIADKKAVDEEKRTKKELRKEYKGLFKRNKTSEEKPKEELVKNKKLEDMTDAELRAAITRKQLEQQYSQLNPKHVSTGKKIVGRVASTAFDASMEAGKGLLRDWLTKKGKEALGLSNKDSLEQLKNESLRLTYKNTIAKAKKEMADRKTDEEWDLPNLRRAQETAELRTKIYDGYKKVNDVSTKNVNNKTIDVDAIDVVEDKKKKKKK